MFSKALFKQSTKANSMRWMTITLATCIMLMVIIIVLGSINVAGINESLRNVFENANQEASIKTNAVDAYDLYLDSVDISHALNGYANGNQTMDSQQESSLGSIWNIAANEYETALADFEEEKGGVATAEEKQTIRKNLAPQLIDYFEGNGVDTSSLGFERDQLEKMLVCLMRAYDGHHIRYESGKGQEFIAAAKDVLKNAYLFQVEEVSYATAMQRENATEEFGTATATAMKDMAAAAMANYHGDGSAANHNKPEYYEAASVAASTLLAQMAEYIAPAEYTAQEIAAFQISVKVIGENAINTYQTWMNAGVEKAEARSIATQSISDQIPEDVQKTLQDLGGMDVSGLIVGEMFYKMAGLLLPMVFVITTANGLLAGQVDSGAMAYVLSTPTKRRAVTLTQMLYLVVAVVSMYAALTVTSIVTLAVVGADFGISLVDLLLLNVGAAVTMLSISGFCFMCSAIFNRSKHSMSMGGGLSIFFLVCTILGLFGSTAMPQALRIGAMDAFNYLSLISLFDTTAILNGGLSFIWKLVVLAAVGAICFVIGLIKFEKKDLPL